MAPGISEDTLSTTSNRDQPESLQAYISKLFGLRHVFAQELHHGVHDIESIFNGTHHIAQYHPLDANDADAPREGGSSRLRSKDPASNDYDDGDWASVMRRSIEESSRVFRQFDHMMKQFSVFDDHEKGWLSAAQFSKCPPTGQGADEDSTKAEGSSQSTEKEYYGPTCHRQEVVSDQFSQRKQEPMQLSTGTGAYSRLIGFTNASDASKIDQNDEGTRRHTSHSQTKRLCSSSLATTESPWDALFRSIEHNDQNTVTSTSIHIFTHSDGSVIKKCVVTVKEADGKQTIEESSEQLSPPYPVRTASSLRDEKRKASPGYVSSWSRFGDGWFWSSR